MVSRAAVHGVYGVATVICVAALIAAAVIVGVAIARLPSVEWHFFDVHREHSQRVQREQAPGPETHPVHRDRRTADALVRFAGPGEPTHRTFGHYHRPPRPMHRPPPDTPAPWYHDWGPPGRPRLGQRQAGVDGTLVTDAGTDANAQRSEYLDESASSAANDSIEAMLAAKREKAAVKDGKTAPVTDDRTKL